jgi:hypothetical protein
MMTLYDLLFPILLVGLAACLSKINQVISIHKCITDLLWGVVLALTLSATIIFALMTRLGRLHLDDFM